MHVNLLFCNGLLKHTNKSLVMAQSRTTISQKVSVITLGCSKNTVDSEVLSGHLKAAHLELTDDPKRHHLSSSILVVL